MAKYTIELSSLYMATVTASSPNVDRSVFSPSPVQALNDDHTVLAFFSDNVGTFPYQVSDDEAINQQFLVNFERAFLRHFYTLEISQENPLSWFMSLADYLNNEMPRFIKEFKALESDNWLNTGQAKNDSTTHSTANQNGTASSNQLNANADTPQSELDFTLGTSDPTTDYNFKYASVVAGAKSGSKSTNDATQDNQSTVTSTNRNASIMQLITELETFSNGLYLNMWERAARQYHLFLGVIS